MKYTQPLFYALVAFPNIVGVNKKDANQELYFYKEQLKGSV
jgi:hypothetical protein